MEREAQRRVAQEVASTLAKYSQGPDDEHEPSKAELQLALLRNSVGELCEIGNLEPNDRVTAITSRLLRAITPLRNLEQMLVRIVELERMERHVKSSTPTPGMAVK
jgi:hypothetical protein